MLIINAKHGRLLFCKPTDRHLRMPEDTPLVNLRNARVRVVCEHLTDLHDFISLSIGRDLSAIKEFAASMWTVPDNPGEELPPGDWSFQANIDMADAQVAVCLLLYEAAGAVK